MLAIWGVATILGVLAAIASRRVSPFGALLIVPVLTCLGAGFGMRTSGFILSGLTTIAPVVAMFVFAILFFGVLTDAGVTAPMIRILLRAIGRRPSYIVPGTALLAFLLHLDGSGAVVFLIAIPTLLPLYTELGMDRRILACAASLAAGVNFLPWTGPTLRAATALHTTPIALFRPLIPVQCVGMLYVFAVCYWLGRREEQRLGPASPVALQIVERSADATELSKAKLILDVLLVLTVLGVMISGLIEPAILFMLGTAIALLINFPNLKDQGAAIERHSRPAIVMTAILCAAGALTGILKGTGMLNAMAAGLTRHLPASGVHHLPFILGMVAMPLSLLFDPDSFYFGVLPVLAATVQAFGIPGATVGQAALLGQMTTGFPVSPLTPATFLVTGLSDIDLGSHQRFSGPLLFGASVVMTLVAALLGVIPF